MLNKIDIRQQKDSSATILDEIKNNACPVAIWGLGGMISFICKNLRQYGVQIDYIIENNKEKCGREYEGIPIISFDEIKSICKDINILIGVVTPKYVDEIMNQIRIESSFEKVYFFEMFYPFGQHAVDVIEKNIENINAVINFLGDEKSKDIYNRKILYMLNKEKGMFDDVKNADRDQYFATELFDLNKMSGLFIDGGAFRGENTDILFEKYPNTLLKSICIDAEGKNIEAIKEKDFGVRQVECRYGALGEKNDFIFFEEAGERGGRASKEGIGKKVPLIGIDDEFFGQKIAFIKLDIEGSEQDCIKGAQKVIQRDRPILAICIYHSIEDHWEIPLLIKKIRPDYNIYIRHYHYMGIETVVYAV